MVKLLGNILNISAILERWKLALGTDKVGRMIMKGEKQDFKKHTQRSINIS